MKKRRLSVEENMKKPVNHTGIISGDFVRCPVRFVLIVEAPPECFNRLPYQQPEKYIAMSATSQTVDSPEKDAPASSKSLIQWSLFWGGLFTIFFYVALFNGLITNALIVQYTAGHPIEYVILGMAMVGFAFVLIKYREVRREWKRLAYGAILPPRAAERVPASQAGDYLDSVRRHTAKHGRSRLGARMKAGLEYLQRGGDPELLDMELRHLAEQDADDVDNDYGFVRTILWAVPMLGFLGTVVGITLALSNLDLNAITESSKALSAGLSVAFDTTALGIGLDLALYFCQFLVYQKEMEMLRAVDQRMDHEMRGRFLPESETGGNNGDVAAVRKMLTRLVESLEGLIHELIQSQSEIWGRAMADADKRNQTIASESALLIRSSLTEGIEANLHRHADGLMKLEAATHERLRAESSRFHESLRLNVETLATLQNGLIRQTETMNELIAATGQVATLEERLNANLAALGNAGNFEQTVNSLAAVIHLLNGKLHVGVSEPLVRSRRSGDTAEEKGYAA